MDSRLPFFRAFASLAAVTLLIGCTVASSSTPTPAAKTAVSSPAPQTPTIAAVKPTIGIPTAMPTELPRPGSPTPTPAVVIEGVTIVSSFPRSGTAKGETDSIVNSVRMAIDERGGKAGRMPVDYQDWDNSSPGTGMWDATRERDNANRAVGDQNVIAYLGTFDSGSAQISIPILNRDDLVMVSPANTYPGLTKRIPGMVENDEPDRYYPSGRRNYARVVPTDELQGIAGANWAKSLGAKNIYVLDDTRLYGRGLASVFSEQAKKIDLTVVGSSGVNANAPDYRALASDVRSRNADLVYFGGLAQNKAGLLWKELRSILGTSIKLMGPDGIFEDAFLREAGDAAEGTYVTFGAIPPDKLSGKGAEWYKRYKDKFKTEPGAYAAYGYDAAGAVLDAIQRAGKKSRPGIRNEIFATKNYNGILGTWSITQTGDTTLTSVSGHVVRGGKFTFAQILPAS